MHTNSITLREKDLGFVSLDEARDILGLDEREDDFNAYLLMTASFTVEEYCMRRLRYRRHTQYIDFGNTATQALGEYPVREVLSVRSKPPRSAFYEKDEAFEANPLGLENLPCLLTVRRSLRILRIEYTAGYRLDDSARASGHVNPSTMSKDEVLDETPPDLKAACIELAAWNYQRHSKCKIGVEGNNRRSGEHFENRIPENVRLLLRNYQRKTI